jgi:hypothetical protein
MAIKILDGRGRGYEAQVDSSGRLFTIGIAEEPIFHAAITGAAYNLHTSKLTLTNASASGIFYIKNDNPDKLLICQEIYAFLGNSDSPGDVELIAYSNPTEGTLISGGATIVPINRDLGNTVPAQATVLEGGQGYTLTNGTEVSAAIVQDGSGMGTVLSFVLPNGASMAVTVTPPTGNTSMDVRIRLVFYYDGTN